MQRGSPDLNEDVQPVENHVGNLGSKTQISKEVIAVHRLHSSVASAELVIDEVLQMEWHSYHS